MKTKLLLLLAVGALLAPAGSARADGTFQILDEFNDYFFPGTIFSSADGSVLGGEWGGLYLYSTAGGYQPIDNPVNAGAYSISGNGRNLAVTYTDNDGLNRAGIWNVDDGFMLVEPMPDGEACGSDLSSSYALSHDAGVLVGLHWVPGCAARAFKWTAAGGSVNLGSSGGSSRATGVSADGGTVVGFDEHPEQGYRRPALWTDGVAGPQLVAGADANGEFYDVSSDGAMACGTVDGQAMYWDAEVGAVGIGTLPGDEDWGAIAFAISDDGKVVGMSGSQFFGTPRAFIWTLELGIMTLSDYLVQEGVTGYADELLNSALDISADGTTIVGAALTATGFTYLPFVVRLTDVVANEAPDEGPSVEGLPMATALAGAYPNPFNPATMVKFSLDREQHVRLSVHDAAGRVVTELVDGAFATGQHEVLWRGVDATGRGVASGTYLFVMETEDGVRTSKAVLVR